MRIVDQIRGSATLALNVRSRTMRGRPEDVATPFQQLVPVAPVERSEHPSRLSQRPVAAFLAHLIATDRKMPQTRERRREEPEVAVAIYAAASSAPATQGQVFSGSM